MPSPLTIPEKLDVFDVALSSIDYHGARYSAWSMYRILTSGEFYAPPPETKLASRLRSTCIAMFEETYGAKISSRTIILDDRLPPLEMLEMTDTGSLSSTYEPGTPFILETPPKSAYDSQWIRSQSFSVPFITRAKASLLNAARGKQKTLVYIVTDTGEIEEFQQVQAEPELAARLMSHTTDLVTRATGRNAPEPGDEDVEKAYIADAEAREKSGEVPVRRNIEENSHELSVVRNYISLRAFQREADAAASVATKQAKSAKSAVMALLKGCDELVLPDGQIIVPTIGRKRPSFNNGAQWINIDVAEAPKST